MHKHQMQMHQVTMINPLPKPFSIVTISLAETNFYRFYITNRKLPRHHYKWTIKWTYNSFTSSPLLPIHKQQRKHMNSTRIKGSRSHFA